MSIPKVALVRRGFLWHNSSHQKGDDGNEYAREADSEPGSGVSRGSRMDGKSSRSRELKPKPEARE